MHTLGTVNSARNNSKARATTVLNRIADRVDLAIDVLTLGQYGLEEGPGGASPAREETGHKLSVHRERRESRRQSARRRGDCEPAQPMSWDWPRERRDAISPR